jgi:hypothetical protein
MRKRVTYDVISYGEWTKPRMKDFRERCCDCGLIHRLDFRSVDGRWNFVRGARPRARRRPLRLQVQGGRRRFRRASCPIPQFRDVHPHRDPRFGEDFGPQRLLGR